MLSPSLSTRLALHCKRMHRHFTLWAQYSRHLANVILFFHKTTYWHFIAAVTVSSSLQLTVASSVSFGGASQRSIEGTDQLSTCDSLVVHIRSPAREPNESSIERVHWRYDMSGCSTLFTLTVLKRRKPFSLRYSWLRVVGENESRIKTRASWTFDCTDACK